jgi:hypothetical protein
MHTIDPKDAFLDNVTALQSRYAEFAPEDRQLAESGLASYAGLLEEEGDAETKQRVGASE